MQTRWLALAAVLALAPAARADEPFALKVLYAGNPGSDRETDFKTFLEEHSAQVGTADYRTFTEASSPFKVGGSILMVTGKARTPSPYSRPNAYHLRNYPRTGYSL